MKIFNKFLAIVLVLSVLFSNLQFDNVIASSNIKISDTKIVVKVGKCHKLKITGTYKKAKWSSSNTSVATVNQNGKVAAKKKGKAIITAKVVKKKLKCTVIVKKPADNIPEIPVLTPTVKPVEKPTASPTVTPTASPTATPVWHPTAAPTTTPVWHPTSSPVWHPTATPTVTPVEHPTASPTPTVIPTENTSRTVYVTKTGKRYHYDSQCNGGSYYASTLAEAKRRGLTPCNKCVK